jgi:elongation factor 1-gamma
MHNHYIERQNRTLDTLEGHLKNRTFFVGERITLADLWIAAIVQLAVQITLDATVRPKYPSLIRHLETIVNQPKLKDFYGETKYCEKAAQFVPPAKEKKEPKPVAAPSAPKAEKAEKKPKKEEEEDEDEPLVPAEPKVKNPLDDLPKSTFNLEDWKRAYSNKETRGPGGSIEWFYEK